MSRRLIIIGAGVAGLAAGCYAQMNGYQTTILEMAHTPGGLCTSWRRKGYLFDGSVAGLAGSAPGSPLYRIWQELGVAKDCPLHNGENFGHIVAPDGQSLTAYTNIDRLESSLLQAFPTEARPIREFIGALRSVVDLDIPLNDGEGWQAVKQGFSAFASSMAHLPALMKYGSMTIETFSHKFKNPFLVTAFQNLVHFGGPDVPLLTLLLPIAYSHRRMTGIPLHGWLSFARTIENRFLALGGAIEYGKKVTSLVVENGVVKGVELGDGSRRAAERVLSAADGRYTQQVLLKKPLEQIEKSFQPGDISDQPVQINFGVDCHCLPEDGAVTYLLPEPILAAGRAQHRITAHNRDYDVQAAPEGKSSVTVFLDSDYGWWKSIEQDDARYQQEKRHCAEAVLGVLDAHHPGFSAHVEVVDVSTPLTREHFTGNWLGAMQARKPNRSMIKALVQSAPQYANRDIQGFYQAGQWAESWGGITTAAQSARRAIRVLSKRDGKAFITTIP